MTTRTTAPLQKISDFIRKAFCRLCHLVFDVVSLTEAADMIAVSTSSLAHSFREATGKSFKKYLILKKLEKAEQLMQARQDFKIHAKTVGYDDPFLFSRIYKKNRGIPPTDFQKKG